MKYTADELKPLAYPENKPIKEGWYLVHDKDDDAWYRWFYCGTILYMWDVFVDWFIPYRLDELVSDTDELEPLGNSEQLEREDSVSERFEHWDNGSVWFSRGGNKFINIGSVGSSKRFASIDYDELTAFARHYLDLQGYDVTKREPEILPCPICGGKASTITDNINWMGISCDKCKVAQHTMYPEVAIEAWNALPRGEL